MENNFEELIASYIENKVGILEHFLSDALANSLKQNLLDLNQRSLLIDAEPATHKLFIMTARLEVILFIAWIKNTTIHLKTSFLIKLKTLFPI